MQSFSFQASGSSTSIHENLKFNYNQKLGLIEFKDERSLGARIISIAKAVFSFLVRSIIALRSLILNWISGKEFPQATINPTNNELHYQNLPWTSAQESNGLVAGFHGLRGHPVVWKEYEKKISTLAEEKPPHLFFPHIVKKGNCSLAEAATPLLTVINDYLTLFPGKNVTILGTSNGSRIAQYIETHINPDLLGSSKLSFISIAGIHYGTPLIDLADRLSLLWLARLDPKLEEEFHWGSDLAKSELCAWRKRQEIWQQQRRDVHHFYAATPEDEQVTNKASSLPLPPESVSLNYHYCMLPGESHTSIVPAAKEIALEWLLNTR